MKNFNALIRDTLPSKNPAGSWQQGRNMVLNKGHKSVANEDGFKFEYLVEGTIVGSISTIKHIVFFSKNTDGTDEIGLVTVDAVTPTYSTKIKSSLFNFQLNCPIEGVFIYNYKDELSISWNDGVKPNSNTPKAMNLHNPPLALNGDGTLVDDTEFTKIKLFPDIKEANIITSYLTSGNIDGFNMYITYAYVFSDDSATPYFPTSILTFLGKGCEPVDKKGVRLTMSNLDSNFSKLKLGVVLKKDGVLFGYESYTINYTGTDKIIDITSLSSYTSTSAENILLEKSIFNKIGSMTKHENQIIVCNTEIKDAIKFQKYANLITLKPYRYISNDAQVPSLLPDEVYAMYIQVQHLNGSYSEAFHLPGIAPSGTDVDPLTAQQILDYNLQWINGEQYADFKQFHFINNGLVSTNVATDAFGYWENEETYPNTEEYNSTIDYEGTPIIGGTDLRNTPIRYHRMPSLKSSIDNGETEVARAVTSADDEDAHYKIGIMVSDFDTVIPQVLKDQIQGYRLCFVQRDGGNNYVAGNWIRTRRGGQSTHPANIGEVDLEAYNLYNDDPLRAVTFGRGRVLSNELFKFKPTLDVTYIRNNYRLKANIDGLETVLTADEFGEVTNNIKYLPGNNIVAGTQYFEEGITMDVTDANHMSITDVVGNLICNVTAFSHKINLYSGFKSTSFVIMEKTANLGNEVRFKGGDVFNDTEMKLFVSSPLQLANGTGVIKTKEIHIKGVFSPINASKLEIERADQVYDDEVYYDTNDPSNVDTALLNSKEYNFNVKHEADLSVINNISTIISFNFQEKYITRFPFRVNRGIKIPNENLSITSLRTFLTSDYYEMPNDKGEILAVRGMGRKLFIQHRFALFIAFIKDKLVTQNVEAYLGEADLFDRLPQEVIGDDKGYIGSTSKFACIVIKGKYITVNQANGQIFIVRESVEEISKMGNKNWFRANWDNGLDFYELNSNGEKERIDNPYVSVGHLVGYDNEYDRLLFTKKLYKYIGTNPSVTFDGEFYSLNGALLDYDNPLYFTNQSKTLSYYLDTKQWGFEHDYFPNMFYHTSTSLFSIVTRLNGTSKTNIYKHNDKLTKGLYYGQKFESYVDLIFNQNLDVSKVYQSINWITDTIENGGGNNRFKTITHIAIYNNNQCSGIINLKDNHYKLTRNVQDEWNFNDFRDLVINPSNPVINEDGEINENNINNVKLWFDKSNFISKFITVRLIIDNQLNDAVYIHEVKVKSIISNR